MSLFVTINVRKCPILPKTADLEISTNVRPKNVTKCHLSTQNFPSSGYKTKILSPLIVFPFPQMLQNVTIVYTHNPTNQKHQASSYCGIYLVSSLNARQETPKYRSGTAENCRLSLFCLGLGWVLVLLLIILERRLR